MSGRRLLISALAVALAQIGFLSWMIAGRAAILRDGREVLLKVQPVDPRDLLRGDYVVLDYEAATLPAGIIRNAPEDGKVDSGEAVHVRLAPGPNGFWQAVSASLGAPQDEPSAGQVDLRAAAAWAQALDPQSSLEVLFGIERYYVPEGEGRAIEEGMRERIFAIKAAVGSDGTAQIKALMDGDRQLYAEPLY